jgi:uncharacterized membrane protein YgaE (UPF0421/DUF939 family)
MKYKLNMLEPALRILPAIVITFVLAAISYVFKLNYLVIAFVGTGVALILIIFLGVAIELRQDDYLFKKYEASKNKIVVTNNLYECGYCGARFEVKVSFCPVCGRSVKHRC